MRKKKQNHLPYVIRLRIGDEDIRYIKMIVKRGGFKNKSKAMRKAFKAYAIMLTVNMALDDIKNKKH